MANMRNLVFIAILLISSIGLSEIKEDVYDAAFRQIPAGTNLGRTPSGAQCTFSVSYLPGKLDKTLDDKPVYWLRSMMAKISTEDLSMNSFFSEHPISTTGGRGDCPSVQSDKADQFKIRNMTDVCASPRGHHGALGFETNTDGQRVYSIWGKDDVLLATCQLNK
jgi:hypothetical protein